MIILNLSLSLFAAAAEIIADNALSAVSFGIIDVSCVGACVMYSARNIGVRYLGIMYIGIRHIGIRYV